jgi:hypothetical protein
MYVSQPVFGLACLIGGLILIFRVAAWPAQRRAYFSVTQHHHPVCTGGLQFDPGDVDSRDRYMEGAPDRIGHGPGVRTLSRCAPLFALFSQ